MILASSEFGWVNLFLLPQWKEKQWSEAKSRNESCRENIERAGLWGPGGGERGGVEPERAPGITGISGEK